MPRKPFPCAVCGEPLHPGSNTLPEGIATHRRCAPGRETAGDTKPSPPARVGPVAESVRGDALEDDMQDEPPMESRRAELVWMRAVLRQSIRDAPADKRAPLLREFRAVVEELATLGVGRDVEEVRGGGVVDLQAVIAQRLADAQGAGDPVPGADAR